MPKLVSDDIRNKFKSRIRQVVRDLSQPVRLIMGPSTEDCKNCGFDSLKGSSSGVFNTSFVSPYTIFSGTSCERIISPVSFTRGRCPVCYGKGFLTCEAYIDIMANVNWTPPGDLTDLPAGRDGVSPTLIKTDYCYYRFLVDCEGAYIDGVKLELVRPPIMRGLGGKALCLAWFITVDETKKISRKE